MSLAVGLLRQFDETDSMILHLTNVLVLAVNYFSSYFCKDTTDTWLALGRTFTILSLAIVSAVQNYYFPTTKS